jgi:hypothetical protein
MSRKNRCNIKEINKIFPAARNTTDCIKKMEALLYYVSEEPGRQKATQQLQAAISWQDIEIKGTEKKQDHYRIINFSMGGGRWEKKKKQRQKSPPFLRKSSLFFFFLNNTRFNQIKTYCIKKV